MDEPRLDRLRRVLIWGAALLAFGTVARSNVHWPELIATRLDHCPELGCDFIHHYMPQARQLFATPGEIVFGWVYPPLLALALQVLTPFSDAAALRIWMLLQVGLAGCLVVQCRGVLRDVGRWTSWAGALALVVLSLPVLHAIKWGQVSLLVCVVAIWAMRRWTRLAAAALGLLAAIKLYPLVYGAAWLGLRGRAATSRRALAAWLAGVAIAAGALIPLVVLGPTKTGRFFDAALHVRGDTVSYLGGQALWPTLVRWFVNGRHAGLEAAGSRPLLLPLGDVGFGSFADVVRLVLLAAPSIFVLIWTWRRIRVAASPDTRTSLVLLAVGLGLPPGWHHYFAFMPFAIAVGLRSRRLASLLASALALLASALSLVLLADVPGIYFTASAWGCTTVSALAAWLGLVVEGSGGRRLE